MAFQPTLPARGATSRRAVRRGRRPISTHAPRTGSDSRSAASFASSPFQPTLPARGATTCPEPSRQTTEFQPTLPARGATCTTPSKPTPARYFNPRSPHGERRAGLSGRARIHPISTHAPRTGSDAEGERLSFAEQQISTHAPRTGSDVHDSCGRCSSRHFNPRSPHGERQFGRKPDCRFRHISTHAPRTGSDKIRAWNARHEQKFQPTLPARGATGRSGRSRRRCFYFNPRSPHGERPAGSRKRSSR